MGALRFEGRWRCSWRQAAIRAAGGRHSAHLMEQGENLSRERPPRWPPEAKYAGAPHADP